MPKWIEGNNPVKAKDGNKSYSLLISMTVSQAREQKFERMRMLNQMAKEKRNAKVD